MDKKQYLLPPSKGGMAPVNSLTCNCTDFNHTSLPNDSGMAPCKPKPAKFNETI